MSIDIYIYSHIKIYIIIGLFSGHVFGGYIYILTLHATWHSTERTLSVLHVLISYYIHA